MSAPPRIAIIGGGFAGAMLAVQLASKSSRPLRITLYDRAASFARGVAYGTRNPSHLLNVPAGRMGAFPDKIEDFHRWLEKHGARAAAGDFMPRMIYGDYLESLLEGAWRNPNINLETVQAEVIDITANADEIILTLADGAERKADRLALAIGTLPTHPPRFMHPLSRPERYVGNVWSPPKDSILSRSSFSAGDSPVLIIGTGLTMIDMVASLRDRGYTGKIIAVSRHGFLPQPHVQIKQAYPRFLTPESAPRTALGLLRAIRAETKGKDWRAVVDSLRSDTPALWAGLPETERKKLLRALSFWNIHRHRMPPQSALMIAREIQSGMLSVMAESIRSIEEAGEGFLVHIRRKGAHQATPLTVGHILHCAGPVTDIRHGESRLLQNLLRKGLIQPGPLAMGIAANDDGSVKGGMPERIFCLGPLLIGERLETVAVPELRAQAEAVAASLLASL